MSPRPEPIAIVGMACLLPKAQDLATYWKNILAARDCITNVPDGHSWSPEEQYDADPKAPDKTYCRRGGFLDKVPFDPMAYGLPPNVLDATDTSQLLALIVAREALKDAGIDPDGDKWPKDRTACVLGVTGTQELAITLGSRLHGPTWKKAMLRHGVDETLADAVVADIGKHFPEWQEQSFPGLLGNVVAGRIANRLDLGGTNCVVDAACASSLAAIQLAMADLQMGRADVAISGGVDTLNDIFMYMCFSKTPALSKSEDARPFDAKADGILISEGLAMCVLKRLSDAERDGDRVYAVIKGIGSSSDGRFKSIYAPNSAGQVKAVERAYEAAGFGVEDIELIEAHGTGTKAGDLAEVEGLKTVFAKSRRDGRHVAVGTVKSQIGHTKSTAGAAGLIKAALALYHRVLPPTAKIEQPNPKMGFEHSKLYLNTASRPWVRAKDHPRRAGVSAFGFGGSNFHLALEEHGDPDLARPMGAPDEHLVLIGASSAGELVAKVDAAKKTLADAPTPSHGVHAILADWKPSAHVVAFSAAEDVLQARLDVAKELVRTGPGEKDGVRYAVPQDAEKRVAVLFPGQGSQYVEMGRTVAVRHPVVRAALDRAEDAFRTAGRGSLAVKIYPPPAYDDATRTAQQKSLTATEWAQPAIGALSKGLWDALARFGVRPEAVAGHSYGELVALHAAGVLDEQGLWTASRVRGEAMADKGTDRGTMAAVSAPLADVEKVLATLQDGVVLANRNHPRQGVISGSREGVKKALEALSAAGIAGKEIPVSAAFHSALVADAAEPFAAALQGIAFAAPAIPVYADATAEPYPADADAARALLARQITSPVDFVGIVEAMWAKGVRTFVECGPKGVLGGLLRQCLKGRDATIVSVDDEKIDGDAQLKRVLATLAARGVAVDVGPILAETLPAAPMKAGSKATVWLGGANYRKPETKNPPPPQPSALLPRRGTRPPSAEKAGPPPVAASGTSRVAASGLAGGTSTVAANGTSRVAASGLAGGTSSAAPQKTFAAPTVQAAASEDAGRHENGAGRHENGARRQDGPVNGKAAPSRPVTHVLDMNGSMNLSSEAKKTMSAPPKAPAAAVDAGALSALLDSTRQSLAAFQATQERTATVHAEFLRAHAKANESFTTLFQTHARLVELAAGAPVSAAPMMAAPAYVAPQPAPVARPAPAAAPKVNGTHVDAVHGSFLAPEPAKPSALPTMYDTPDQMATFGRIGAASTVRPAIADEMPPLLVPSHEGPARPAQPSAVRRPPSAAAPSAVLPRRGTPPPSAPAAKAVPKANDGAAIVDAMLSTVAEKTGYPRDMLELGMDMESDLGIDSIKRVEILASVQERVPGLPEVDNDKMGALRTVGDVVTYLQGLLGASSGASETLAPTKSAPGAGGGAIVDAMLSTVAEKTGYPRDMLELTMDMESDLGIDSIKRVEILASVQERVPGLPEVDNDRMGALRTVGDVVGYLQGLIGAGGTPAPTSAAPERTAEGGRRTADGDAIVDAMLSTVAEKTGYPRDMLELTMDMESDLGIDSIKRVEILASVQDRVPGLPEVDNDRMGALRTVGDVVTYLQGLLGPADGGGRTADGRDATAPDAAPDDDDVPTRRRVALGAAPEGRRVDLRGRSLLIVADTLDVAPRLAKALEARGVRATVAPHDGPPAVADGVVYLGTLGASGTDLQQRVKAAFRAARAQKGGVLFATVTGLGGTFGFGRPFDGAPVEGALAGLAKTVAQEWEGCRCLAVDVDPRDVDVERLAEELLTDRGVVEVGLSDQTVTVTAVPERVASPRTAPVAPGDLVVVSGGARGVTAAVVVEMAKRWKPSLLLLGRSPVDAADPAWAAGKPTDALKAACLADFKARGVKPTPKDVDKAVAAVLAGREVRQTLADVRAAGSDVAYEAVDVRDPQAVARVLGGRVVRGLVHGAGVIADKLVADKTDEQFESVWSTKVDGLEALLRAIDPGELKMAAFFGSVAGRYGNRGQCDYAMGNEVLAKVAQSLDCGGVPRARCFDWGPWEAGMVTPSLAKALAARGMSMIGLAAGARAFCDELERDGGPVEIVFGGPEHGGPLVGETPAATEAARGEVVHRLQNGPAYLEDHRIAGKAVLPAVMVLEWIARAAREARPGLHVAAVRDFAVLKGVVLEGESADLRLRWAETSPGTLAFQLVGDLHGREVVHYKATVELSSSAPSAGSFPGSNGLGKQPWPLPVDESYRQYLFHGPALRGIERIVGWSDHGIVATLRSSDPKALGVDRASWDTDPLVLDSALQLMVLWVRQTTGAAALPSALGEYRQLAPFRGAVSCHLEFEPTKTATGRFSASFVDAGGRLVAKLVGGEYTASAALNPSFRAQA